MAYAWRISASKIGLNMDRCEEILFLVAFHTARNQFLGEPWVVDFENMFFEQGKGVAERIIFEVNSALRRAGNLKLLIKPVSTGRTDYMRMRGTDKTDARAALFDDITEQRAGSQKLLATARIELKALVQNSQVDEWDIDEQNSMFNDMNTRLNGEVPSVAREISGIMPLSLGETRSRAEALLRVAPDGSDFTLGMRAVTKTHPLRQPEIDQFGSRAEAQPEVSAPALVGPFEHSTSKADHGLLLANPLQQVDQAIIDPVIASVPDWAQAILSCVQSMEARLNAQHEILTLVSAQLASGAAKPGEFASSAASVSIRKSRVQSGPHGKPKVKSKAQSKTQGELTPKIQLDPEGSPKSKPKIEAASKAKAKTKVGATKSRIKAGVEFKPSTLKSKTRSAAM